MYNPQRLQDLQGKVKMSSLLTAQEKSDWLSLLELMNDKQLGELEEILLSGKASGATNSATHQSILPPLSHIANMPEGIAEIKQQSKVEPLDSYKPTPQAPTIVPNVNAPITPESRIQRSSISIMPRTIGAQAYESIAQHAKQAPGLAPVEAKLIPKITKPTPFTELKPPIKLSGPEEVKDFTAVTLRDFDLQSIVDAVKDAISEIGYYQVLELMEASPLFESYIESGKQLLTQGAYSTTATANTLTQPEFEFVADLLKHMQFNRS